METHETPDPTPRQDPRARRRHRHVPPLRERAARLPEDFTRARFLRESAAYLRLGCPPAPGTPGHLQA